MIYLDNSATTQVNPEVLDAMLPYLREEYGNPSSKYYSLAENAKAAVIKARTQVADLLGCDPEEVIFTSGSTESNNTIIKGVADFYKNQGNHIVTTKVEHASIMETYKFLEKRGFRATYLDVDRFGRINPDQLEQILKEDKPILVSIIWGNNELGSLNPIEEVATLCEKYEVFFHTDATQVIGRIPVNLSSLSGIRFLSCSGHKFHGPKGVGAMIIRKHKLGYKTKITPLLHGGGQEFEYRSGTLAVHNIVGLGKAAELRTQNMNSSVKYLAHLEELLVSKLVKSSKVCFNNDVQSKIPGVINFQVQGKMNELLIKQLSSKLAFSTGSACSSDKPSHVLAAIGLNLDRIRSSFRISLSEEQTEADIETISSLLLKAIE